MPYVTIDFDQHGAIGVEAGVFHSWFEPQRYMLSPFLVDGSEIVDFLYTYLHNRYNIDRTTIRVTLWTLFGYLNPPVSHIPGETRIRVASALVDAFYDDFIAGIWPDQFRRSRRCYIILAYLAKEWESVLLAGAMREFWSACGSTIAMHDPLYSHEWKTARKQLPGLWDDGMVHRPERTVHRGRTPSRWPRDWRGYRELSLPAIKLKPGPESQVAISGSSSLPWSSPMPVGFPITNYFDDIDQLKWQQHAMNNKLDTMDQKLDLMLFKF